MNTGSAILLALGLTVGSFLYELIVNKRRWGQATEHSYFMAFAILVFAITNHNNHPHAWDAILLALGLTVGSFLYELIVNKRRWGQATEHSYFMAFAVLICMLTATS